MKERKVGMAQVCRHRLWLNNFPLGGDTEVGIISDPAADMLTDTIHEWVGTGGRPLTQIEADLVIDHNTAEGIGTHTDKIVTNQLLPDFLRRKHG